jgi:hypothetical protein
MGLYQSIVKWLGSKSKPEYQPPAPEAVDSEIGKDAYIVNEMEWRDDLDDESLRTEYKEMLADPAVKAALFTKLFEVCSLDMTVNPAEGYEDDERAKETAKFVRFCLHSLKGGLASGLLMKIARPALEYQYSINEMVLQYQEGGAWDGKYTLKCLKQKDVTADWSFTLDAFKNVTGLVHSSVDGRHEYPPEKFVHYAFMPEFENPRGMSDLRAARRAWFVKRYTMRAMGVTADKGGNMIVGHSSPHDRASMDAQLAKANGRRWMNIPLEARVEIINLATDALIRGWNQAVDLYDKQIFLGIQGAFLQSLEGQKTGARNIGEVHASTSSLFVWFSSYELASVINDQVVPLLVRLNFADAPVPVVTLEAPTVEDLKVKADTVKVLSEIGYNPSKKWLGDTFGVPAAEDEGDTVERPAAPSPFGGAPGQPPAPDAHAEPEPEGVEVDADVKPITMAAHDDNWLRSYLAEQNRARRPR